MKPSLTLGGNASLIIQHTLRIFDTSQNITSMEATRKGRRLYCAHCEDFISRALYHEHRKTYYLNGVWMKNPVKAEPLSRGCNDGEETMQATTPWSQESSEPFPRASPAPSMETASPDAPKDLFRKMDAFMESVNKRLGRMESMLLEVREELRAAREQEPPPKKQKRSGNCAASEAVRRLHNLENNTHRYDPQTSVSSPHNQGVTTHLLREVSLALPDVKSEVIMASCKTYFETIRKSYRMNQEENLQKKEENRISARMRQRKRRLYNARAGVLETGEKSLWETATVDLMSEEEDTILDGRPVWVVRPPPRSAELSTLCGVLQQRLDMDQKYVATHRQRVTSLQADGH